MPPISEIPPFSVETTISVIRNYYSFLTEMYLNDSDVIEPPEGGWPSITHERFRSLGKTYEVVNLLRHLPYVRETLGIIEPQASAHTCFADWQSIAQRFDPNDPEDVDGIRITTEDEVLEEYENRVPGHVIGLTDGGRNNNIFLLDTNLNVIFWLGGSGPVKGLACREPITGYCPHDDDDIPENEANWRGDADAWAVEDFFEVLKDNFRQLRFIPDGSRQVWEMWTEFGIGREDVIPTVQEIYREHGWPDLGRYRKAECIAAVRKTLLERYDMPSFD